MADDPTPDELRAAAERRIQRTPDPGRRRSITRSFTDPNTGEKRAAWADAPVASVPANAATPAATSGFVSSTAPLNLAPAVSYSISNVTGGEALGLTYTQVSLKLPDDPLGNALAAALADGVGPSISAIAREWMAVGAQQYLASKSTNEGNPAT